MVFPVTGGYAHDVRRGDSFHRWIAVVPNALSLGRLGLAGLFPFTVGGWQLGVVIAAGCTDAADGFIARRFNVCSGWGGLLDGIADKVFVLSVMATLTLDGTLQPWQTALLLSRDATVALIALYTALRRRWAEFKRMPARLLGKAATAALFMLFVTLLLGPASRLANVLLIVTMLVATAAALDYSVVFLRTHKRIQHALLR